MPWISTVVTSFGYGHDRPPQATITLDVRTTLRNPHHDPAMRELTGLHPDVRRHVMDTPGARDLVGGTVRQVLDLLRDSANPAGVRVDVAVGCVGGRHRSVALAEEISMLLELAGVGTEVEHRDIGKPLLASGH